jgi:DNA-binding response OmpR family regulator
MIVEDEPHIGALVRTYLERAGYEAVWVRSGEEALARLERRAQTSLVVLDIGLPGIDGFEVCRRIGGAVPVIMLTARDEEPDRVAGLEVGADDYVTKPFSPRELTARVKAVLRRSTRVGGAGVGAACAPLELGPVRIDPASREVHVGEREIALTQREFDLLEYLVRHRGQVVGREQLLEYVWDFRSPGATRTVEVHIAQLRKKLGLPELIHTVRGLGYKASA